MIFKRTFFLMLSLLIIVSCGETTDKLSPEEEAALSEQNQQFFDIVYLAEGFRELGTTNWRPVSGQKKMKFCSKDNSSCFNDVGLEKKVICQDIKYRNECNNQENNACEWIPDSYKCQDRTDNTFDGYFAFFHIRYQETSFAEPCSGGYIGTYQTGLTETAEEGEEGWSVFEPYIPSNGGRQDDSSIDDEEDEVKEVLGFEFNSAILENEINLDDSCPNPYYNTTYRIQRYHNGDVIAIDYSRSVQYYFRPLFKQ